MKANELMIGNLVLYNQYKIGEVHGISSNKFGVGIHIHFDDCVIGCQEECISGIALTEEYLLKFGFCVGRKDYSLNTGRELFEYATKDKFIIWHNTNKGYCLNVLPSREEHYIKSVHQLQNLFYALTGEELTLK